MVAIAMTIVAVDSVEQSLGCIIDQALRTFGNASLIASPMSKSYCAFICWNYPYYGIELRTECYCGLYGSIIKPAASTRCNQTCSGDVPNQCGGTWSLSAWAHTPAEYQNETSCAATEQVIVVKDYALQLVTSKAVNSSVMMYVSSRTCRFKVVSANSSTPVVQLASFSATLNDTFNVYEADGITSVPGFKPITGYVAFSFQELFIKCISKPTSVISYSFRLIGDALDQDDCVQCVDATRYIRSNAIKRDVDRV